MTIDLEEYPIESVFSHTEKTLGVRLRRETPAYGWGGKSVGLRTNEGTWVRISYRSESQINERTWTGEECASVLHGIAKPTLLRSARWLDAQQGIVWRADELTLADGPLISPTPEITETPTLSPEWWASLRSSLVALSSHKTTRVGVRQDLVNRRINEFTDSSASCVIDEWATAHADLHWANLTAPALQILDWEGWGIGPRGLDAATLWAFSLLVPSIASRIQHEFKKDLSTRSGKLAQLFMCVELLHMIHKYGDHPHLEEPLSRAASGLALELKASV
ncbi:MAG: hypothetical protein ACRDZ4_11825 [Egibacteraceae bacterium]